MLSLVRLPALLLALLAATLTVVLAPSPALACKCAPAGVTAHAKRADAVFSGVVTDVARETRRSSSGGSTKRPRELRVYTVDVERAYQGKPGATATIRSEASPAACGLGPITEGEAWVFFVTGSRDRFSGTACGGSAPASAAYVHKVERVLGPGRVEVDPAPPTPPLSFQRVESATPQPLGRMVAPGAALALVALLGLALLGRRGTARE